MISDKYFKNLKISTRLNIIYSILLCSILIITFIFIILGVIYYLYKGVNDSVEFLEILVKVLGFAFILGTILIAILGSKASKTSLKPLENLTQVVKEINIEKLDKRISYTGANDEIKSLANSFDNMIERLEGSFKKQNQFVSDVSHELKTPISIILGYANLLDRWGKNDPEVMEKCIIAIKKESKNISEIIQKLLYLTKSDTKLLKINKENFFINDMIDELVYEFKILNEDKRIYSSSNEKFEIYADFAILKQILRIFIDNSIKYTKTDGNIDIYTKIDEKFVIIYIKDNGIGIDKEHLNNIFDRFYKVDESRNRETGGSGLRTFNS